MNERTNDKKKNRKILQTTVANIDCCFGLPMFLLFLLLLLLLKLMTLILLLLLLLLFCIVFVSVVIVVVVFVLFDRKHKQNTNKYRFLLAFFS